MREFESPRAYQTPVVPMSHSSAIRRRIAHLPRQLVRDPNVLEEYYPRMQILTVHGILARWRFDTQTIAGKCELEPRPTGIQGYAQ